MNKKSSMPNKCNSYSNPRNKNVRRSIFGHNVWEFIQFSAFFTSVRWIHQKTITPCGLQGQNLQQTNVSLSILLKLIRPIWVRSVWKWIEIPLLYLRPVQGFAGVPQGWLHLLGHQSFKRAFSDQTIFIILPMEMPSPMSGLPIRHEKLRNQHDGLF